MGYNPRMDKSATAPKSSLTGGDLLTALSTPIGLTGLFILGSYLLPELGVPVFLTVEVRADASAVFFCAFAIWVYSEMLRAQKGMRVIPENKSLLPLWALGHAIALGVLGYLLFLVIMFPAAALFAILGELAKSASPRPSYLQRVAFDLIFAVGLGLSAAGVLPLAQRLGVAAGPPRENKRWIAFAALVALGSLCIAVVAMIGRVNPLYFRRLFLPPVEG